ncbi:uncharacterized protein LOC128266221 [Drosophila gunungcola]|uniref:Uncharacterized protein n=1 Tax=Drosophila gunungcola TaxID=103775 RepID=A0A9P9YZU4_9MUSC|nr:uncharacterized protein LOC128266221 [Drosophila gunungcola]KAI8046141.1 hypothetical protein M5D96_002341 [Drosophila gunungcola]
MYRTCFLLLALLAVASAGRDYLPRPPTKAYVYGTPPPSTMAQLRRIIQGHLERFQKADEAHFSRRANIQLLKSEVLGAEKKQQAMQLWVVRTPTISGSASENALDYALAPNTPIPKDYAHKFLPEGKDVVPGSSYIPLRLLVIKR